MIKILEWQFPENDFGEPGAFTTSAAVTIVLAVTLRSGGGGEGGDSSRGATMMWAVVELVDTNILSEAITRHPWERVAVE